MLLLDLPLADLLSIMQRSREGKIPLREPLEMAGKETVLETYFLVVLIMWFSLSRMSFWGG